MLEREIRPDGDCYSWSMRVYVVLIRPRLALWPVIQASRYDDFVRFLKMKRKRNLYKIEQAMAPYDADSAPSIDRSREKPALFALAPAIANDISTACISK